MFDVILVTHKNTMTTSGTRIQGLYSTQVHHHTQLDLLTCRVYFVKHMMITAQVRHHTHLDLTTRRVCSFKHVFSHNFHFLISLLLVCAVLYNFGSEGSTVTQQFVMGFFGGECHWGLGRGVSSGTPLVPHSAYLWFTPVGARRLRAKAPPLATCP